MLQVYSLLLIFLTLFSLIPYSSAAAEFNVFKSYANSKVKPPQYAKNEKRKRHSIDEYLSGKQEMMMKLRKQDNPAGFMFSENWSGFNPEENARITPLRRLSVIAPLALVNKIKSSSIMSYALVAVLALVGFTSYNKYVVNDSKYIYIDNEVDTNVVEEESV